MSSTFPRVTNVIHICDFIDVIDSDQNWSEDENYVKIHCSINVFQEDNFFNMRIAVKSIPCSIHTYLNRVDQETYNTDAFFYTAGRFSTAILEDELQIVVQALSLQRHDVFSLFLTQLSFLTSPF